MEFSIADMIKAAWEESPSDFQTAFNAMMLDKVATAIDVKRQELAQNFFNTDDDQEEYEEDQSNEDTEENPGSEEREASASDAS